MQPPPPGSQPAGFESVERYFERLEEAFAAAARCAPLAIEARRLARRGVRLAFAGRALRSALVPALEHLEATDPGGAPDLEISCWDAAESGVPLPDPPWIWPASTDRVQVALPRTTETHRLYLTPDRTVVILFDVVRRAAFACVQDARLLPTHWHGSPLLSVFHWWAGTQGLRLLHAGCVGTEAGGVLLVGPPRSGKSTAALLSAIGGLRYVSDDYCLLDAGASPVVAHSLYGSGKLRRDHLAQFPELAAASIDPRPDEFGQAVVFVQRHFPRAIAQELDVRAVLVLRVAGGAHPVVERISGAEALRAMAPTTLLQMPDAADGSLAAMAQLARELPCFRFDVGSSVETIAQRIRALIAAPL